MKTFVAALGILCSLSLDSWAAPIGSVTENKGVNCSIERNNKKSPGLTGAQIESMDTYSTESCASSITFKDDTKVKITENSKLVIDDFVYDPKQSDAGKLALKVGLGTVRYASGQIAKTNPQQVAVNTPTATVSVRGTDFTMTVDETGQSLIILVPSCKDDTEMKKYELEENKCRVGRIEVANQAGSVVLDQAFHATYVASANSLPTPPTILNIIESKINNNLILVKPMEIQKAVKDNKKTARDKELEELEEEAQRQIAQRIQKAKEETEAKLLALAEEKAGNSCNPTPVICVYWEKLESMDVQSRGKGVAYRVQPNEHYAEVKTQGYQSNTFLTITQNDSVATELIGDGSPGGNVVNIKQNNGVLKK